MKITYKYLEEAFERVKKLTSQYRLKVNDGRVGGVEIVDVTKRNRQVFSGENREAAAWINGFITSWFSPRPQHELLEAAKALVEEIKNTVQANPDMRQYPEWGSLSRLEAAIKEVEVK